MAFLTLTLEPDASLLPGRSIRSRIHRSTVWVRRCLEQVLPPETAPELVLPQVSFLFWHVSVLLNHTVSQFGKMIMEAEYSRVS